MPRSSAILPCLVLSILFSVSGRAFSQEYSSWNAIADAMVEFLDIAGEKYREGDVDGAKNSVNDAYFGLYEKMGFERTVMSYISGKRVSLVEYKFSFVKKEMTKNAPVAEVLAELAELSRLLKEDADQLDGKTDGAPEENAEFIMPTADELKAFEEAVSPEGLTPEEFEELKIKYITEQRRRKENK